jgi:hypothetical protein
VQLLEDAHPSARIGFDVGEPYLLTCIYPLASPGQQS